MCLIRERASTNKFVLSLFSLFITFTLSLAYIPIDSGRSGRKAAGPGQDSTTPNQSPPRLAGFHESESKSNLILFHASDIPSLDLAATTQNQSPTITRAGPAPGGAGPVNTRAGAGLHPFTPFLHPFTPFFTPFPTGLLGYTLFTPFLHLFLHLFTVPARPGNLCIYTKVS